MGNENLNIFSVTFNSVYKSSLTEVVNQSGVDLKENDKSKFFYAKSSINSVQELSSEDTPSFYIYENHNGDLYFYRTLEGFADTFEDDIRDGCKFYEVEEITESWVYEIEHAKRSTHILAMLRGIPNEGCALLLKDLNTNKATKVVSFNRSNFLEILHYITDTNYTHEIFIKDTSKLSSTLGVPRFISLIDEVKYATVWDKTPNKEHKFYDYLSTEKDVLLEEIKHMRSDEWMIRDIITTNCNPFKSELASVDYLMLEKAVEKVIKALSEELTQLSSYISPTQELKSSMSTDPLA